MSYSLESKCGACKKASQCSDGDVLNGAINGIHYMGHTKGHKGYGVIKLECGAFEEVQQPKKGDAIKYVKHDGITVNATVAEVWGPTCINLVWGDNFRATSVMYSDSKQPSTWHY